MGNHIWILLLLSFSSLTCASYLFIGGYTSSVSVYNLDENTGGVSFIENVTSSSVTWLDWIPNSNYIYGANEGYNQLTSYYLNTSTGDLSVLNTISSGGTGPVSVAVHDNNNYLVSAHYTSGDVVVFSILGNGTLSNIVASVNAGIKAHQVVLDGNFVFVPCLGSDYIAQYIINPNSGVLTANEVPTLNLTIGQGPRHLVIHPFLPSAYVINELGSTVSLLAYDDQQGTLSFVSQYSTLLPDFNSSNTGAEVLLSPDGRFLYASNRGNNSIALFSINQTDGSLTLQNLVAENGINIPRSFAISPSGEVMVVANQNGGSIMIFSLDVNTGLPELKQGIYGFQSPAFVGIYSTTVPTTTTTGSTTNGTTITSGSSISTTTTSSSHIITPMIFVCAIEIVLLFIGSRFFRF